MKTLIALIMFFRFALDSAAAQVQASSMLPHPDECGKINEEYFYNEQNVVALDEFPWIGLVLFNKTNKITSNQCGAVLIGKRHVLADSSCLLEIKNGEALSVVLGPWNASVIAQDCQERRQCGAHTQLYEIDEIVVNPNYDEKYYLHLNDVGLLRLKRDVVFNEYIQPICLPPAPTTVETYDIVGQYMTYAGFELRSKNKQKTVAHMRSLQSCRRSYESVKDLIIAENFACASCYGERRFLPGAALMGVSTTVDLQPRNFYIYGLLLGGPPQCSSDSADIFIRVAPFLDWIKYNMI